MMIADCLCKMLGQFDLLKQHLLFQLQFNILLVSYCEPGLSIASLNRELYESEGIVNILS